MRHVIIKETEENIAETVEESLVRNLQECLGIMNKVIETLKEEKVDVLFEVLPFNSPPSCIAIRKIKIAEALKNIKINYVSRQEETGK
jgi:hypothetical protein